MKKRFAHSTLGSIFAIEQRWREFIEIINLKLKKNYERKKKGN